MHKQIKLYILLLIGIPAFCQEKTTVSFDSYLSELKLKLTEIRQNKNNVLKSEINVFKANSLHNVTLGTSVNGMYNKNFYDQHITNETDTITGINGEVTLKTTLPSGTRINLGGGVELSQTTGDIKQESFQETSQVPFIRQVDLTGSYTDSYVDPFIKIGFVQPLLYNWFGFLDRFSKNDSKMKLDIEKLKEADNNKNILVQYKKLYFSWIIYEKLLILIDKSIDNSILVQNETEQKLKAGIAEKDELQRTVYAVQKYQEQKIQLQRTYNQILNQVSMFFDIEKVKPDHTSIDSIYQKAISTGLTFMSFGQTRYAKVLNLTKENILYLKKIRKNQTLPELNIVNDYEFQFHNKQNVTKMKDTKASTQYPSYRNLKIVLGLQLSFPIGNHKALGELKEANLLIDELIAQYEMAERNYLLSQKNVKNNIIKYKELLATKDSIIKTLNIQHEEEKVKYNQARLNLNYLLDTNNLIVTEKIAYLQLQNNIVNIYLDYLNLME